ncbi:MAG: hypothetical protein V3T83_04975 [Acidobacteriota bacterium]
MKLRRFSHLITWLALGTLSMQAGIIPGRWEKVDTLVPDTEIVVMLDSGERLVARYQESSPAAILVRRPDGKELELPKRAVEKVVLAGVKKKDRIWDGLAIGAAVGAGSYLIGHAASCCAPNAPHDAAFAGVFAAIGMGIGALIDFAVRQEEVLYRAK